MTEEKMRWRDKATKAESETMRSKWEYRDYILRALLEYSGPVHRSKVIKRAEELRKSASVNVPKTPEETVQWCFNSHCAESDVFCGKSELSLFIWPFGKGDGRWGINESVCRDYVRRQVWTIDDL